MARVAFVLIVNGAARATGNGTNSCTLTTAQKCADSSSGCGTTAHSQSGIPFGMPALHRTPLLRSGVCALAGSALHYLCRTRHDGGKE